MPSNKESMKGKMPQRASAGNLGKGQTNNPRGRAACKELQSLRLRAQELIGPHAQEIIDGLLNLGRHADNEMVRYKAYCQLADRLWGRPPQYVELAGANGGPLSVAVDLQAEMLFARALGVDDAAGAVSNPAAGKSAE